ncbi:hypothetical protein [Ferdinandcohnia sp. SAFN-114]|uniref:hypothetical protein n=1 Tax=Ferdinandcohnia sp. SAFN-114 TaxID=3387275 RepID=UPI003F814547
MIDEEKVIDLEEMTIPEEIKIVFKDDPLYQLIEEEGLTEELIPNSLLDGLNRKNQYTISEAADKLGKKDYQLRNIVQRNGLEEYVQISQAGKLYRLDYRGIYRLYLIFLLQDQLGKRPVDIASLVGVMPETIKEETPKTKQVVRKGTTTTAIPSDISEHLNGMENQMFSMFLYMQMTREYDLKKQSYVKALEDVSVWEKDMEHINNLIELHESVLQLVREEEKELQSIRKNMNNVVKGINQNLEDAAKSQVEMYERVNRQVNENVGFFGKLFGKKKTEQESPKIAFRQIPIANEESKDVVPTKVEELEKLKNSRIELEKRKQVVHENKEKALAEYVEIKDKIIKEKQRLLNEINNPSMKLFLEQDPISKNIDSLLLEGKKGE